MTNINSYEHMTTEECVAELPFTWQLGKRLDLMEQVLNSAVDEDKQQVFADSRTYLDHYLIPSGVTADLRRIIADTPAAFEALIDTSIENPTQAFESEVLGIDPSSVSDSDRQYDSPTGFGFPGTYPLQAFADALHADPERVHDFAAQNWNVAPISARLGDYVVGVCAQAPWLDQSQIGLYDPFKLTDAGKDVASKTLQLIEKYQNQLNS